MTNEKMGRRFRLMMLVTVSSVVFVSSCNMKSCWSDDGNTNRAGSGSTNGAININGGDITSNTNEQVANDDSNTNNANTNNSNKISKPPQPPERPRLPDSHLFSQVQRLYSKVYVPALFGRDPIPNDNWHQLLVGNIIRTDELGQAKLKFDDCEDIYLHRHGSRLKAGRCRSNTGHSGNVVCAQSGSLSYIKRCGSRVRTIQTDSAIIVPRGTRLNVTYNERDKTTTVSVFENRAEVTYIIGSERNAQGRLVPITMTVPVEAGECAVNKTGSADSTVEAGVPVRTAVRNERCEQAVGPFIDNIQQLQESLGTPVLPGPVFNPDELRLERPPFGTRVTRDVIVENRSMLRLKITSIDISGDEFTYDLANSSCKLGQLFEGQCTLRIAYTPRPDGSHLGTLKLSSTSGDGPDELSLLDCTTPGCAITSIIDTKTPGDTKIPGDTKTLDDTKTPGDTKTSFEPSVSLEPSVELPFELQKVGSAGATQTVTFTNTGTGRIKVTDVALQGGDGNFSKTDNCLNKELGTRDKCSVEVSYTPKSGGTHDARLVFSVAPAGVVVAGTLPVKVKEVKLSGKGGIPVAMISTPELCFGRWKKVKPEEPNTPREMLDVTLFSTGTAPVSVSDVEIQGVYKDDFAIRADSCKGKNIGVGDSCRITVRFSPKEAKVRRATLIIKHDGRNSASRIPLAGTDPKPTPERALAFEHTSATPVQLSGVGKPRNWFLRIFDRLFAEKRQTCGSKCND